MRELGNGRWDKILMRRMVELSVADNYNEAKEEWLATGEVWWRGNGNIPQWVLNSRNGEGKCLCGHPIVYHFQITNTENGIIECVGSDHINSYMIMRQISEEYQREIGEITEQEVEQWLKVRVGSMKAEAWWAENGEQFEKMFEKVKEVDLWKHSRIKDYVWSSEHRRNKPVRVLRKKGKGAFGSSNYQMASIVWRWNHPENPKNQQTVHGYPNDNLMADLYLYSLTCDNDIVQMNNEKELWATYAREVAAHREQQRIQREAREAQARERRRLQQEKWERERPERERREREAREARIKQQKLRELARIKVNQEVMDEDNEHIRNLCGYFGVPFIHSTLGLEPADFNSLADIKKDWMTVKKPAMNTHTSSILRNVFRKPLTEKQKTTLARFNYFDTDLLTIESAYYKIKEMEEKI